MYISYYNKYILFLIKSVQNCNYNKKLITTMLKPREKTSNFLMELKKCIYYFKQAFFFLILIFIFT